MSSKEQEIVMISIRLYLRTVEMSSNMYLYDLIVKLILAKTSFRMNWIFANRKSVLETKQQSSWLAKLQFLWQDATLPRLQFPPTYTKNIRNIQKYAQFVNDSNSLTVLHVLEKKKSPVECNKLINPMVNKTDSLGSYL